MHQLGQALESDRRIGVAVGILMARLELTTRRRSMLAKASQTSNRKLRDLVEDVISTGEIA